MLLNRDPDVHLQNLKTTPEIEEVANTCVECGFCEPVCPSRHLTLTPRQRIVVRREMARQPKGSPVQTALLEEYEYEGLETCAADGTLRARLPARDRHGQAGQGASARLEHGERAERRAERGSPERWAARRAPRARRAAGRAARSAGCRAAPGARARALLSDELVPDFPREMPRAGVGQLPETEREGAAAVYVPACVNRIFGRARGAPTTTARCPQALVELSARAGLPLWIPDDVAGHLLRDAVELEGLPRRAHELMANRTVEALWRWSGEGELPVVIDASSCALGLRRRGRRRR